MRCFSWLFLFLAAVVLAGGCSGDPQAKVKGTVRIDGKPLADAGVQFWPKGDLTLGVYGGQTDPEGRFQLKSRESEWVKPGRYVVIIAKEVDKQGKVPVFKEGEDMMKYAAPGMLHNILPGVYKDRDRSPFTVEVAPGDNELGPFDLKSRPQG
jgi:hypothetical protein